MGKKVYTPNKFLDVVLPLAFTAITGYVMYYIYKEGLYFWKLILSVIVVSVVVPTIEVSLRLFGKWASEHYLGDEKHGDPLSKAYTLKKFVDQGWQFVYHSVFSLWEYLLLKKYHWFNDTRIFIPVSEAANPPDDIRLIFIVQIALWIFQAFRHVFVNQRKKDYYELFAHHIVTMCLCFVAYTSHYRSGLLILFLHDFSDILVDTLKILNLCNIAGEKDYFILEIEYVCTLIVWIYERLYTFPYIFLIKEYKPMMEYYEGLSFWEIFKQEYIMILQGICLAVLYALHWYWFILLCRIGFRAFVAERENYRKIQKDEYEGASDSEDNDDDEEEEEKTKKKSD